MKLTELYEKFVDQLSSFYDKREASNISDWVFESSAGITRTTWLLQKNEEVAEELSAILLRQLQELLREKPVQYVLGESYFYKKRYLVNKHVLIPRPETEELVEQVLQYIKAKKTPHASVIDIGTGSGCIPISIKSNIVSLEVSAIDISPDAMDVARQNASIFHTDIHFYTLDFLDENAWQNLPVYDIIVSNPPYIPLSEKINLARNVTEFEPSIALFVPDSDPVVFYSKIKEFAAEHLSHDGCIFVEIHENHAAEVSEVFNDNRWVVTVIQDIYGRERMLRIQRVS